MKLHNPELISALVDGELKGPRRFLVQRHLRHCALCAAEYRHLHHVREMLAASPPRAQMEQSADFFWAKVRSEIQTRQGQDVELPAPRLGLSDWLLQHRLAVVSASAAAALCVVIGLGQVRRSNHPAELVMGRLPPPVVINEGAPVAADERASVEGVATAIPETVATPVNTQDKDVAVIWVSGLPWTPTMKDMKTKFANLGI